MHFSQVIYIYLIFKVNIMSEQNRATPLALSGQITSSSVFYKTWDEHGSNTLEGQNQHGLHGPRLRIYNPPSNSFLSIQAHQPSQSKCVGTAAKADEKWVLLSMGAKFAMSHSFWGLLRTKMLWTIQEDMLTIANIFYDKTILCQAQCCSFQWICKARACWWQ